MKILNQFNILPPPNGLMPSMNKAIEAKSKRLNVKSDAKGEGFFSNLTLHLSPHSAFTLAEVLITLGIIGVVAAMTIPNLLANKEKQETAAKLLKNYAVITQAVKQSEMDNGPNQYWDWGTSGDSASIKQSFDTYWAPYLKILKYCSSYTTCGYSSNFPVDMINGTFAAGLTDSTSRTAVILADGSFLTIKNATYIVLDINAGKGPNLWGKDVFMFMMDSNKGFMPISYTEDYNTTNIHCKTVSSQYYCTAKIMKDGWQIANDYPWK